MQTAINTELISFKDWTLRVRSSSAEKPRLLVMIHGWTGDENSMWVFTSRLAADYWIIAPRAPHTAAPSGFSWRIRPAPSALQADQDSDFGRPSLEMLLPSAEALINLIDEYTASVKLEAWQFDLIGFSQGAAMVNVLGLLYPQRVRKMGVLAGFLPSGLDDVIAKKPLVGKNIFVAHGTQDQMVPVDRARASMERLEQAGAQITYCEDEIGHKLSSNCLRTLEGYLTS